jgi:hypothetical protein
MDVQMRLHRHEKTGSDAALTAQCLANGDPTRIDLTVAKVAADDLQELID